MWYKARSVTNKLLMAPKTVQLHVPKVDEIAKEFMLYIDGILDDNNETPDDFLDSLNRWSLESLGCIALDTRLGVMGNKSQDLRAERMTKVMVIIFIRFLCCYLSYSWVNKCLFYAVSLRFSHLFGDFIKPENSRNL